MLSCLISNVKLKNVSSHDHTKAFLVPRIKLNFVAKQLPTLTNTWLNSQAVWMYRIMYNYIIMKKNTINIENNQQDGSTDAVKAL